MPIYEYRCSRCAEQFDRLVRTAAEARATTCPECSSTDVEKVPSTFALGKSCASNDMRANCRGSAGPCADPKRCCAK